MSGLTKFSLFLSITLIFVIIGTTMANTGIDITNPNGKKTATVVNEIVAYETEYVYNPEVPSDADPVVLEKGENGVDLTYDGIERVHLSDSKNEVVQVGTAPVGTYNGRLTGYGPDCPGCSLVGNVACKTREGTKHSLIFDGVYYSDTEYGDVRILAADNTAFPCGTIVKVNTGRVGEFLGVVLDSGSSMRNAWSEGNVWMDLAFDSQASARTAGVTSSTTEFVVQRWGW